MKKIINSESAPEAIGPYSHGTSLGNLIFTSGQLPINKADNGNIPQDITAQSYQALENLKSVLVAGGSSLENVLKTTCFLSDIEDFAAFNTVYSEYFQKECPARSCFAVKTLPLGVKVEVEAIAYKS